MTATVPISSSAGVACLTLVLLPFATVGVFTTDRGMRDALRD
jgi:hypothetical protein